MRTAIALTALLVSSLASAGAAEEPPVRPDWTVDTGERTEVAPPEAEEEEAPAMESADDDDADADDEDALRYEFHGYYRARTHVVGNQMYPLESTEDARMQTLRYVTQRLRLQPLVGYGEWAVLRMTFDLLDNVIWGDNAGLATTPLFAGDPSLTGLLGAERPSLMIRHAWVESKLPIGVLRVGRQPSQWGLGILTEDGEGFKNDFGDAWYGTTYDRILFATKPISIVRAIAGMESIDTPLVLAAAWDKLVEDFLPEGTTRSAYDSGWLAGDDDDVDEWVVAAAWSQQDLQWLGDQDALSAGVYFVYREQPSTSSEVFILDVFLKLRLWEFFLEGEFDMMRGSTYAIPLGPEDPVTGRYPYKEADIFGWLVRAGWTHGMWTVKVQSGYASGDAEPTDSNFSGRALHPDVNVGLILYEELLAERTRQAWAGNQGLWSKGGVYNSYFFNAIGIVEPLPRLQITLGILTGWADEVCDAVYQGIGCLDPAAHPNLGVEIDASIRYRFYDDHVLGVLEGGWFRPSNAAFGLVDPVDGRDIYGLADTDMWTLQTRLAFVF
jgi:hypothetical protein